MNRAVSARKNRLKVIVFVLLAFAGVAISRLPQLRDVITFEWVNAQIDMVAAVLNRPIWGPTLYVTLSALMIIAQVPGLIMVFVGAVVYDLGQAFLLCWIASNIGTVLSFLAARFFLHDYVAPKFEKSALAPLKSRIETDGILTMWMLRLVFAMVPPVNWMVGATRIPLRDYVIGNALGLAPLIFGIQFTVQRLQEVRSTGDLFQPGTIAILAGAITAVAVIMIVKSRYFMARATGEEESP